MKDEEKVRIDKWLWAVRIFKTRSRAAEACGAGNVTVAGRRVKASRAVGAGEVVCVRAAGLTRTLRVRAPVEKRVGAALVPDFLEDLTPSAEYERRRRESRDPFRRSRGEGRPTKRERRILDLLRRMD